MSITVAVCTFNRAESLRRTLESFTQQAGVLSDQWQLWIVDNNSNDHTKRVIESFFQKLPLSYLFVAEQGLSAARNAMVDVCQTKYLFFTDDDVSVHERWVSELFSAVTRCPEAGYFGGRILPRWDVPRPGWLKDLDLPMISSLYCYFELGDTERSFSMNDPMPFGANMGFKVENLRNAGPFRTDLGPMGLVPGRGDDSDMIQRLRLADISGVYLPNAICYHEFSLQRMRIGYLYRYGFEKGKAASLTDSAPNGSLWRQVVYGAKGLLQLLKGRGDRFRQCVINIGIQRGLVFKTKRGRLSP